MSQQLALRKIMEEHTERLIRVAFYYTKELQTAEDMVQDVFIKFHQNLHKYQEQGELKAYLTRLTINRCKDYLKSWHVRKLEFQQKWAEQVEEKDLSRFVRKDEETIISEAIMKLPIKHREVLVYYYFEEMTSLQIANLLQIPQSTVKTRLTRAKQLLKPALQGIEWEVLTHE